MRKACSGSVLLITLVVFVVLLGFLGIAVYSGLNAFLQAELQRAASAAVMAGASSLYDDTNATSNAPQRNTSQALTATQETFDNIVAHSRPLTGYLAALDLPVYDPVDDRIHVQSRLQIPTPLFSPLGINQLIVDAQGDARYVKMVLENPVNLNTQTGPWVQEITLDYPVVDGPGADIYIRQPPTSSGGFHGLIFEACSGTRCYDITRAVRFESNQGLALDVTFDSPPAPPKNQRRVAYAGGYYIDLNGVNLPRGYNIHTPAQFDVLKATKLRIIDDGIFDQYNPTTGRRSLELQPAATQVSRIEVYHQAIMCPPSVPCPPPAGSVFKPAGY
ncbi:MAG: hypothetical protein K2X01_10125 [Cyanobacteria bacterium]|nr:hypothetical protein [Cyanobacteriota bacterium]